MNEYKKCDYIYDGILFSHKKEGNSALCSDIDESKRHYAKWNAPDKDKYCMISLTCET